MAEISVSNKIKQGIRPNMLQMIDVDMSSKDTTERILSN